VRLDWRGLVSPDQIPSLDRSAHLLFAADLNPACPNAAIEAMACGLPVIAFETGALPELVQADAGRLAPYGGDPWKLEPPDLEGLAEAGEQVLGDQPRFRAGARARAEAAFGLERMVDGYLQQLAG
jgi:glycosyltransferase involved in cell wall biosynthesis